MHERFHNFVTAKKKSIMATKWKIDTAHSEIQFKVKHLMISTVTGSFKSFDLEVLTNGEDFSDTSGVKFTADVNSIDTNNAQRDAHLKSADFFDAEKFPKITFESEGFVNDGRLNGTLTIKDITKPFILDVEYGGNVVDPYGQDKAGFTIEGKISRKDFGLTWDAVTETGAVVVGNDIRINAEIQLIKQA